MPDAHPSSKKRASPVAAAVRSRTLWPQALAGAYGSLLGLALVKFGNPIIFDRLIEAPKDIWQFVFQPWPVRWGIAFLAACVIPALAVIRFPKHVPKWVLILPCVWLGWQLLSALNTVDPKLTRPTVIHFTCCLVSFFIGLLSLGQGKHLKAFWLPLLLAFGFMLWTGFEQHYGGLEATRAFIYEQPNWQALPAEYLKKIQSNRIFATLVYPNALAGAILLLLPAMLVVTWNLSTRMTDASRAVLVGVLAYGGLACLYWSGSKSGWLIGLALALVTLLRHPFSRRIKVIVIGTVLLLGLSGFLMKYAPYFRRGAPSVSARFEYWRAALRTAIENPVLGTGPGTFSVAYRQIKPAEAEMAQLTHNDYLEQASDSGFVGAIAYLAFIVGSVLWLSWVRPIFGRCDLFAVWLGVVGWSLQSSVEFLLYIPGLAWAAFAFLGWLWASSEWDKAVDSPTVS